MLTALRLGLGIVIRGTLAGSQPGKSLFERWLREDDGQDLIEYALLCSAIGFAGAVAFSFVSDAMNTSYSKWDSAVQTDGLVEIPDPVPPEEP